MLTPRQRHVAIAVGLLAAVVLEIVVGFARFGELDPASRGREWVIVATVLAIVLTSAVGLQLFRMSVRQGRADADRLAAVERERSARLAEVGQLAAGIAHEIHNPLQGVSGYLALLERDGLDVEKRRGHVAAIRAALETIERLTRDLLESATPATPHAVEVAPYHLLRNFERSLAADPRFAQIARRVDVERGVPSVRADASALERALLNLALNARDAMEGRGAIELLARRGAPGTVELEVADTGRGISESMRAHLFEPFRSERGSTGLGLWICASIARANGGTIRAESGASSGARFILTLPASTP